MDFPSALREWRKERGLSQRALAAMLGVTCTTIHKYEHGIIKISPTVGAALADSGFPDEYINYGGCYTKTSKEVMTDEEREFAEKHYGLLVCFLKDYSLCFEDWYDNALSGV